MLLPPPAAPLILAVATLLAACAETPPSPPIATPAARPTGGRVVIDCVVGTDHRSRDCRVVQSDGGPQQARAVLTWLTGPDAPRASPVSELHRWEIYFSPP